jgi:GcrA cell cycle regulator
MTWTEERIQLLAKLWSEGLSASQIAAELGGGASRNAVLGKAHRLGLVRHETEAPSTARSPRMSRPTTPPTVADPPKPQAPAPAPLPVEQQPVSQPARTSPAQAVLLPRSAGVTIMELREAMCRFPLGDPTTPEFRFCGAQASTGLPYCAHHAQIAYVPAAERKRVRA